MRHGEGLLMALTENMILDTEYYIEQTILYCIESDHLKTYMIKISRERYKHIKRVI